ncbi:putative HTH-type transcriptional regulator YdfH [Corynebacterium belfantii]|nr:putative HTH-type transcriptional regulator YdfH [Corynebacterium belfantii]
MSYSQHDPHVAGLLDDTSELPAAERAYLYLKQQITHGHLSDNDMISEGDIGKVLSLSRTPIREAFIRLETEGFLRLYPKRGALIVHSEERTSATFTIPVTSSRLTQPKKLRNYQTHNERRSSQR